MLTAVNGASILQFTHQRMGIPGGLSAGWGFTAIENPLP
jgi:hypothetical protein